MAARKFGSTGNESYTWAMNAYLPARVAERYRFSRVVAFSSGNVYPLVKERRRRDRGHPPEPIGEYAMSALARERLLSHSVKNGADGAAAAELRGRAAIRRAADIRTKARAATGGPGDGQRNVIRQDANSICLGSFALASRRRWCSTTGGKVGAPVRCGSADLRRRAGLLVNGERAVEQRGAVLPAVGYPA
jgi:hypothetical protein